jgi:hypothetical protein
METTTTTERPTILEKAWLRHAELDDAANKLTKRHLQLRKWVAILGVVATFLAIFIDTFNAQLPVSVQAVLKVLLIATPLLASMVAAFTSREMGDGRWLSMRAGAEEIKKEIYLYRTVLSRYPERGKWLSNKLANIQRQVYKNSSNTLDTIPYKGQLPPKYHADDPESDTGFNDLTAEQYIRCRLQHQLSYHERKIVQLSKEKRNLTIAILGMGALGALLAGIGGPFAVWVALTASLTAALTGWEELRNREKTIANYSKVKLELTIIRDYWYGLTPAEQNDTAFYRMVTAAENVLFAQLSEWVRSMQEALTGAEEEDRKLAEEMVQISVNTNAELQRKMLAESQAVFAQTSEQLAAVAEDAATTVSGMVTAVSDEAIALNQTMGTAVETAVAQAATARQLAENEVDAWEATSQDALAAAAATADAARESTAAQVEAWQDTAQTVMDTAATESAAMQEAAQTAVDEAAAVAAAAREAAISETAAWGETAQEVVDTAVDESAALRSSVEGSAKYALDFTPVAEQVEDAALEAQKVYEQVAYTAEPDVKYAVQFVTPEEEKLEIRN